jgi:hypothetical protein
MKKNLTCVGLFTGMGGTSLGDARAVCESVVAHHERN